MMSKLTTIALLAAALWLGGCGSKKEPDPAAKAPAKGTATATGAASATGATGPGTATAPAAVELETSEISYNAGQTILKGYVAAPKGATKRPGVLVVHEWWGHNEYVRMRARKLAELGYVALAVDMYGDGKTVETPDEAGKLAGEVYGDPAAMKARFEAARAVLAKDPHVDPDKIGAVGYCFGGGIILAMARAGVDLDAVGSFHGSLETKTPMAKGAFAGKIYVATGGADPMVPAEHVEAIKKEMSDAGVSLAVSVFDGATHAFTNPDATANGEKFKLPIKYDAKADAASWDELKAFLAAVWPS